MNHNFIPGPIVPILDPESEVNTNKIKIIPFFVEPQTILNSKIKIENVGIPSMNSTSFNLKCLQSLTSDSTLTTKKNLLVCTWYSFPGCCWSKINLSCVYNCVFMSLFGIYMENNLVCSHELTSNFIITNTLDLSFKNLLQNNLYTIGIFDEHQDKFCDALFCKYPNKFPHFGQHGTSVTAIIDILFLLDTCQMMIVFKCPLGCPTSTKLTNNTSFPTIISPSLFNDPLSLSPINTNHYVLYML